MLNDTNKLTIKESVDYLCQIVHKREKKDAATSEYSKALQAKAEKISTRQAEVI
jgi:hypothetical protein